MSRFPSLPSTPGPLAAVAAVLAIHAAAAQAPPDRGLLPDAAVVAIEVPAPAAAVDDLLAALGPVPAGLPVALQGRVAVGLTALALALGARPALWAERLAGGGAVLGLLPIGARLVPVALTRPGDPDAARRWLARTAPAVRATFVDGLLLLAPDDAALAVLRERLAAGPGRWAACPGGLAAVGGAAAAVQAVIDVDGLRRHYGAAWPAPESLAGGARVVFGPLVRGFTDARWLRLGVAGGGAMAIGFASDVDLRDGALGALCTPAPAPLPPLPPDALLALRLDRSWHTLLAAPERFLGPAGVRAVRGFLSIADSLDGARTSFVDDVLGGLAEPIDLLVWTSVEEAAAASPLLLPQVALVARVAGDAAEPALARMARALATIANAERARNGQLPFLVRVRRGDDGAHGLVAEAPPWRGPGRPPVDRQLSPTLWFANGCVALASTEAAARAAVAAAATAGAGAGAGAGVAARTRDRLELRGAALAAMLRQNRAVVELGRLLDEGERPEQAADFAVALGVVADAIAALTVEVASGADGTRGTLVLQRAMAAVAAEGVR